MNWLDFLKYYGLVKDLLFWIFRRISGKEDTTEQPVESPIVKQIAWDEASRGFRVPKGFQCAVIQAGAIQTQLGEGHYSRRALRKIAGRMGVTTHAKALLYRETEFALNFTIQPLFTSDHLELSIDFRASIRIQPEHLLNGAEQNALITPTQFQERLVESLAAPAQDWISSLSGEAIVRAEGLESICRQNILGWIERTTKSSIYALAQVVQARLYSEFLDNTFKKLAEIAQEQGNLAVLLERNRVRGSCRQAMIAGKLREIQDEDRFEDAMRALEQDRVLKQKALQMELQQHEMDELQNRIEISRRKFTILKQALDDAAGYQSANQMAARLCESLELKAVNSAESPFSPQEREQIRTLLKARTQNQHTTEEILAAVARDSDIRFSLFNPFEGLRGLHTLKVGDGWRIFDGEYLWQVRLTLIKTRRHGFLWLKESPSRTSFEIKGSPGGRRLTQELKAAELNYLHLGSNDLPIELTEGSAAQITMRISQIPRTKSVKP